MFLQSLILRSFKNYREARFEFGPELNCLTGSNGSGKTNVLDAIWYLAFTRSYFSSSDQVQVKFGEDYFFIEGNLVYNENSDLIRLAFQKGEGKSLVVNNNEVRKFSSHFGLLPVVMIAPGDISLVQEGSEERRKFVDMVISLTDKTYLHELMSYTRVLEQRNKLLRDFGLTGQFNRDLLETYNVQLERSAAYIYQCRLSFVNSVTTSVIFHYNWIAGSKEKVSMEYSSDLANYTMYTLLRRHEEDDLEAQRTTRGLHKDEFVFTINDKPIRKYGSQGQQKSFLIALKLSQFDYLYGKCEQKPVLLLDDIFEKLDLERLSRLFRWINEGRFGQVFITDTQKERIEKILENCSLEVKYFEIENGEIQHSQEE